jgi:subtilisin-like proprotein convertase family protein
VVRTRAYLIASVMAIMGLGIPAVPKASSATHCFEQQYHLAIPAVSGMTQGWMSDAILDVPSHLIITDLDVTITLTHTNVFDLQLLLESPSGTSVTLNLYNPDTGYFHGADYDRTVFDDEADRSIQEGRPPFTGHFRPLAPGVLSVFDGEDAYGLWRLRICDAFYADTGELRTFGLFITAPAPTAFALVLTGVVFIRRLKCRVNQH